ncbi:hypothetical protein GGI07_003912 [Coemansia sp. Benny D115]|nr:hypothetical protein GGI07_003912 [Coemansia sp. Benny D115]
MEAEIPAASLKAFHKALQCLARISSDISFEAHANQLSLVGVSSSRSAYASFTFQYHFFDAYSVQGIDEEDPKSAFRCRVQAKLLVGIFKARGTNAPVERCTLRIDQGNDPVNPTGECRLVVRMAYKEGICRTHRLFYELCNVMRSNNDRSECKSRWRVSAKAASAWIGHFTRGLEEMSLRMSPQNVLVRSWADGSYAGNTQIDAAVSDSTRALQTELSIDTADFDLYHLASGRTVELTFGLREFRAILQYAENMALPLTAYFNGGGEPILFTVGASREGDTNRAGHRDYALPPDDVIAEFAVATIGEIMPSFASSYATPVPSNNSPHEQPSPQVGTFTPHTATARAHRIEDSSTPPPPHALVARRVSQMSIQDTATPPRRSIVCHAVDEISTQGSNSIERTIWSTGELDRRDSLLFTPNSSSAKSGARDAIPLSAAAPEHATPTQPSRHGAHMSSNEIMGHTSATRSYRLLDMPRPQAPPGVTDSQLSNENEASEDENALAPPGKLQTRLPFQSTSVKKPTTILRKVHENSSEEYEDVGEGYYNHEEGDDNNDEEYDDDDDEELGATPPPPSKRIHII